MKNVTPSMSLRQKKRAWYPENCQSKVNSVKDFSCRLYVEPVTRFLVGIF